MTGSTAERQRLDGSLASSVGWTAFAKVVTQLFTWVSTFWVARLLSPGDYGLYGMASVFVWAVYAIGEFGLGSAIVKHRELTRQQIAQINGFCILAGLASAAAVAAAAGPLSVFFGEPALQEVVVVVSLMFAINGLRNVPSALLQRDLRFKRLAVNESLGAAALAIAVLGFALLGWGVWSLVLGNLVSTAVATLDLLSARPHRIEFPNAGTIQEATEFGRDVMISRFAWYAMFNMDFLVTGRALGKAALGAYSFAWSLASLPVDKISMLVTRVSMPHFSAVQDQPGELRRYLRLMTGTLAFVTFPAALGLGLLAEDVVRIALGDKWLGVVVPLQILAAVAPLRAVGTLFPQLVPVVNETRFGVRHGIVSALFLTVAFWIGSRWGTSGVALAWIAGYPLVLAILARRVLRAIALPAREYLSWLIPAVACSAVMAATVLGARWLFTGDLPLVARAAAEVTIGVVGYGLAAWWLDRERLVKLAGLVRRRRAA